MLWNKLNEKEKDQEKKAEDNLEMEEKEKNNFKKMNKI